MTGSSVAHQYDAVAVRVRELQDASAAARLWAVVVGAVGGRAVCRGVEVGLLEDDARSAGTVGLESHLESEPVTEVPFEQSVHRP